MRNWGSVGEKGVGLRMLNLGLDTANPSDKLTFNAFGAVSQFEREIVLERQKEGMAKARRDGKYTGRNPKARDQKRSIAQILKQGLTGKVVAEKRGISLRSVRRHSAGSP